jgi:hypothetical protein
LFCPNWTHQDASSECKITAVLNDAIKHLVVDRTFVADSTRWIIDYKLALPPANVDQFLKQHYEFYQEKLSQYAAAFSLLNHQPICLGLYFPLFGGWIEKKRSTTGSRY